MQLTTFLTAALLATASLAAPASAPASAPAPAQAAVASAKSMMAGGQWTIQAFTRTCNAADTTCAYRFAVSPNDGSPAAKCSYAVSGRPASHAPASGVKCGAFTVSSSWSGQFGPGNGFTTFAVVKGGKIVYPAYRDSQLPTGVAVKPEQSYTPQNLP